MSTMHHPIFMDIGHPAEEEASAILPSTWIILVRSLYTFSRVTFFVYFQDTNRIHKMQMWGCRMFLAMAHIGEAREGGQHALGVVIPPTWIILVRSLRDFSRAILLVYFPNTNHIPKMRMWGCRVFFAPWGMDKELSEDVSVLSIEDIFGEVSLFCGYITL